MINAQKIADPAWNSILAKIANVGASFASDIQNVVDEPGDLSPCIPVSFGRDDIAEVLGAWYGDAAEHMEGVPHNDGIAARAIFRLNDGRFADLVWCRKHGTGSVFASAFAARRLDDLLKGYTAFDRAELGLSAAHTN